MEEIIPKYTVLERTDDGREVRLYANGDKRNERGQLLQLPTAMQPHIITNSEKSLELHSQRKQKILQAIEERVMDVTHTKEPAHAIAHVVGKRAEVAMKDKTRTGNDAAKIVLAALDAYQDKRSVSTNVLRNEYVMDAETRALLERIAEARHSTNVLEDDGEITGEIE